MLAALCGTVAAQSYPNKPVKLIVPFAPGGPIDIIARPVAQGLTEVIGQPVVVDFRAGANGNIGAEYVAKSAPDGYTLLLISSAITISPSTYARLPFNVERDFAPISLVAASDIVLLVNPTVPAHSVKELVALAKRQPDKLTYGSSGTGGSLHLSGELLKTMTGIEMLHVPYKGAGPAMVDLLGGHFDLMFISAPPAVPHIKSGKLRALGVASAERMPALPDVPTMIEAGLPGFEVTARYGIVAPAATPKDIIDKLNAGLVQILQTQEAKDRFAALGLRTMSDTPAEFASYIRTEIAKWAKVAKAARLTPQ